MPAKPRQKRRSGCPVNLSLEIFGDRWSLLIVRDLMVRGYRTYKEFQHSGEEISTNILSERLVSLEADGVLTRTADSADGRKLIYRLTEKGIALAPVVLELLVWGARHNHSGAPIEVIDHMAANRERGTERGAPPLGRARRYTLPPPISQYEEGESMSHVRVLVGTRKGAFILTSDEARRDWKVFGPHFAGWEIYHLKASPVAPERLYASQSSSWFGQVIQRSDDGGATWAPVGNHFTYDGIPGTHQWYDGTPHPWEFKRVWHLEPSLTCPDTVFAGVEDAALFRSTDAGTTWEELSGLRKHGTGPAWQPGAGGMCLHTILLSPENPERITIAISSAGAFRSDDGGESWKPINKGLRSAHIPDPDAEVGHCVHHIAASPERPGTLFMQKHWDVMRSDDAGDSWHEVSGNLPTDFGFCIDVHAHEPETIYVVPIQSDSLHYVHEGKLRVYRSRTGGESWEALTNGLPQENCFVNVLRDAMATDSMASCGVYFGTSGGQVYCSADAGDTWSAIVRDLPPVLSVEVQTLP